MNKKVYCSTQTFKKRAQQSKYVGGTGNAGINLTGYHPPRAPRGFCTEMCAQPQGFCTTENAGGRAYNSQCPRGRAFASTGFQT